MFILTSMRNVRDLDKMHICNNIFITAVCVVILIKLRWPKTKSLYDICAFVFCVNMYIIFRRIAKWYRHERSLICLTCFLIHGLKFKTLIIWINMIFFSFYSNKSCHLSEFTPKFFGGLFGACSEYKFEVRVSCAALCEIFVWFFCLMF